MADGAVLNPVYNSTDYSYTGTAYVDNNEYSISKTYNSSSGNYTDSYTYGKAYTPEGYVTTLSNPQYYYFRKDHLGNNREVWLANTGATVQRTQYYPSGLPWAESTGQSVQNKKYNGKEFVEAHGLDEYDSEARWYYPAIMRTTTLDPLAEKYYSISPYAWCGNNLVRMIDPDGMDGWDVIRGAIDAFIDDINPNPVAPQISNNSNADDEGDYDIGQVVGHVGAALFGTSEIIDGGEKTVAGTAVAVGGSATGIAIVGGGAVALVGAAEVVHGEMTVVKAFKNIRNVTKVYPTRKEAKDARPKPEPAKKGEKRVTNQSKNKSGEGNKMKTDGGKQTPHFHDKNHQNKNKKNVHYRIKKKQIKPNE